MRVSSPVFVGRLGELHRLQESLGAARDGTPAVFLVTADAGVGKTRFVDEMALRARASGYRVLSGGCVHLRGGALPFEPFVEAFRDLAPEAVGADASTATQGTPSEFARLLAELPASPQTTAGPRDESQSRLFELALGLLRRLSTEAPLLLIVEDIHWADRSTLDLLAFLVRNLRRERVVLLVTCRTDELHRRHPILSFLAELDRSPRIHRLQLRPLERSELAEQLAAIVGADLDPGQLDRIWLRSEGNPFYAEELLAGGAGPELPETLREVLLARISLLSEPAQQLARVASVAGRRVEPELLEASGGLDQGAVEAGLREAVDRRILVVGPDADAEYYAFRHALVGEAIYAELLPGERRSLHASLATALATLPDAGANTGLTAEIAHHWHSARDYPRALAAAVVAGKAAERAYATSEALAQYERALELWERVADAETLAGVDRAELLAWAGRAARNVSASRAVGHIRAAIALIDERADPIRAGLLYEQLSHCSWEALDGELALSAAREALRLVPPEPASIARAIVLAGYAKSLLMSGQRREVIAVCREAVAMSREAGAPGVEGQALCSLGFLICDLEDFDEGVAMCRRAREIGVALDDALLVTRASTLLVSALATNRPELALEVALEAFDYSQRHGFAISYGATQLCTAIDVLYDVGRWDEAEAIAERAGQLPVLGLGEWDLDLSVAQLDIGRGRFEDASRRIASLRSASRLTDPEREAGLQSLVGDLAIWQGDPGRARAAAAQPLGGPASNIATVRYVGAVYAAGLRAEADIAAVFRARRRWADVDDAIGRGCAIAERMRDYAEESAGRLAQEGLASAFLGLCDAELSRLRESVDPGPWSRAAALWEARDCMFPRAYALYREAETQLAAGEGRISAAVPLCKAYEIAVQLRAEPLRREISALAKRGRIELRDPGSKTDETEPTRPSEETAVARPNDAFGLSRRELEVLALLVEGRMNREIAAELYISERTASVHVSHILNKLGVTSRGAAAAVAARLGLVPDPSRAGSG
jgi:DNA-binding CsgD family transcriptional regulator/tetratricopeptide (TPR) repeat protein